MEVSGDIIVLPFFGTGHLNPCMELCKRIASQNYKAIFIIPSNLFSSIPSSFHHHPLVEVVEIQNPSPPPEQADGSGPEPASDSEPGSHPPRQRRAPPMAKGVEKFLSERCSGSGQIRPVCAVVDVMMPWSKDAFVKLNIPIVSFFTSGACSYAMELAKWKADADNVKPGEIRVLPGLPECMALSYADVQRSQRKIPGRNGGGRGGPVAPGSVPGPGGDKRPGGFGPPRRIPWWEDIEGSRALLFNTCDDLDGPFIKYIADQTGKPVWGVGPMLPEEYWKSSGSVIHDQEVRSKKDSNVTEDQVMEWLNSKPKQSVIYISFGSEVGPTIEEFTELAKALESSNRPFIWVIQPGSGLSGPPRSIKSLMGRDEIEEGYYPNGLNEKVGDRGLIIKGWAPQLLILSHTSVGGFLSHCGWNSTVEAIGRGVPILAWPIRGDQPNNAKLVVDHLKVGHTLLSSSDDPFDSVKKDQIVEGIDMLMDDGEVHKRAMELGSKFEGGYPASSAASLKSFIQLVGY